ncbi:hypothetical protein N44_02025 [Microcystis aeruginosa NIES-44]|uniref:Uncharacterized protein n=1 Tax=Microcystis aeruginosa NIES-44 TaxID=449439 RepID=A0A0A1VV25_MICAE|nr:hypothetical protein N44_02025 [Microcystis aeruginosa NIES-44]
MAIPVVKAVAKEVIKALDLSKESNVNVKFTDWQGKKLELFT